MTVHAVTGAFGFSGKYIARRLLSAGKRVVNLTNSPMRPNEFGDSIAVCPYRFDNVDAMAESLRGVDVLYNTYWVRFRHNAFGAVDPVANSRVLFAAAKLAGVSRVVHVSLVNASETSRFENFRNKAVVERLLRDSGLSYAIVRPAALFGPGDVLMNNIAWTLRYSPVFPLFGTGEYHVQPIHVDDLAECMVAQGDLRDTVTLDAVGPEDYAYRDLVPMIRDALGLKRLIVQVPPLIGYWGSRAVGALMRDVTVTRDELDALMADLLHAPGATPVGKTQLSTWVRNTKDTLGKHYASELPRRKNRTLAY